MGEYGITTCSKHNYSGTSTVCPDCYNEMKTKSSMKKIFNSEFIRTIGKELTEPDINKEYQNISNEAISINDLEEGKLYRLGPDLKFYLCGEVDIKRD